MATAIFRQTHELVGMIYTSIHMYVMWKYTAWRCPTEPFYYTVECGTGPLFISLSNLLHTRRANNI
jgi:hypothetical protein